MKKLAADRHPYSTDVQPKVSDSHGKLKALFVQLRPIGSPRTHFLSAIPRVSAARAVALATPRSGRVNGAAHSVKLLLTASSYSLRKAMMSKLADGKLMESV